MGFISLFLYIIYTKSEENENTAYRWVVEFFHLIFFSQTPSTLTFHIPTQRILLRPALRDYGGQVASTYAKASVDKPTYANLLR